LIDCFTRKNELKNITSTDAGYGKSNLITPDFTEDLVAFNANAEKESIVSSWTEFGEKLREEFDIYQCLLVKLTFH
jgi:hypothetical protein